MKLFGLIALTLVTLGAGAPLLAHHSFAAVFDSSKRTTIKGQVSKVDWRNPHMYLYVDAKDATGKMANWACETYPPNVLVRQGWKKTDLKQGDEITITGTVAKDGSNLIFISEIVFPDGSKRLGGAPSGDGSRPQAPPQE